MGKKYCSVPLCSNTSSTILNDVKVTLHRIPSEKKSPELRKQWITYLKNIRQSIAISDSTRVCSVHFEGGISTSKIPSISATSTKQPVKHQLPPHTSPVKITG